MRLPSDYLSEELGLPPEEIIAFTAIRYGWDIDDASEEEVAAVRLDLDSDLCVRTVPDYWWGTDPEGGWGATRMR